MVDAATNAVGLTVNVKVLDAPGGKKMLRVNVLELETEKARAQRLNADKKDKKNNEKESEKNDHDDKDKVKNSKKDTGKAEEDKTEEINERWVPIVAPLYSEGEPNGITLQSLFYLGISDRDRRHLFYALLSFPPSPRDVVFKPFLDAFDDIEDGTPSLPPSHVIYSAGHVEYRVWNVTHWRKAETILRGATARSITKKTYIHGDSKRPNGRRGKGGSKGGKARVTGFGTKEAKVSVVLVEKEKNGEQQEAKTKVAEKNKVTQNTFDGSEGEAQKGKKEAKAPFFAQMELLEKKLAIDDSTSEAQRKSEEMKDDIDKPVTAWARIKSDGIENQPRPAKQKEIKLKHEQAKNASFGKSKMIHTASSDESLKKENMNVLLLSGTENGVKQSVKNTESESSGESNNKKDILAHALADAIEEETKTKVSDAKGKKKIKKKKKKMVHKSVDNISSENKVEAEITKNVTKTHVDGENKDMMSKQHPRRRLLSPLWSDGTQNLNDVPVIGSTQDKSFGRGDDVDISLGVHTDNTPNSLARRFQHRVRRVRGHRSRSNDWAKKLNKAQSEMVTREQARYKAWWTALTSELGQRPAKVNNFSFSFISSLNIYLFTYIHLYSIADRSIHT